jgi:hypothetical protein
MAGELGLINMGATAAADQTKSSQLDGANPEKQEAVAKGQKTGQTIGTIVGGVAGFFVGGPGGAMLGASLGGALGGALGGYIAGNNYDKKNGGGDSEEEAGQNLAAIEADFWAKNQEQLEAAGFTRKSWNDTVAANAKANGASEAELAALGGDADAVQLNEEQQDLVGDAKSGEFAIEDAGDAEAYLNSQGYGFDDSVTVGESTTEDFSVDNVDSFDDSTTIDAYQPANNTYTPTDFSTASTTETGVSFS